VRGPDDPLRPILRGVYRLPARHQPPPSRALTAARLPPRPYSMAAMKEFKGMTCAVVGSSGNILNTSLGDAVVAHDVVLVPLHPYSDAKVANRNVYPAQIQALHRG
jgi:hypothetical protein